MKLIVLGSGTSIPHPKRSSSAYWLETEKSKVLIDCAPSALHRMAEEGCAWDQIDAIWISHWHLDHSGGLGPFLFGSRWAESTKSRTKKLRIFGAVGIKDRLEKIQDAFGSEFLNQSYPVEIVEVEPLEKFNLTDDLKAVTLDTPHTDESRAIHIRDKDDKTLVFSADTGFTETLAAFARKTDLFLLECSYLKDKPVESHIQLNEAIYLARKSGAKRTVLTHLYPEWDDVDFIKEVSGHEPGVDIIEAYDGLRLDI